MILHVTPVFVTNVYTFPRLPHLPSGILIMVSWCGVWILNVLRNGKDFIPCIQRRTTLVIYYVRVDQLHVLGMRDGHPNL